MKLYNSVGPNPHVVRMFMAERGIKVPTEDIDIIKGANRQPDYLEKNPHGQSPALFLDDGSLITEITAICEYLDETQPGDSLIGSTPEERAQTRRWTRWVDLKIVEPMTTAFRGAEGLPMFKDRMRCLPEASEGLKAFTQDNIAFLDEQMASRDYVAGDSFTLADVLLFCFLAFGEQIGQPLNRDFKNVAAWFDKVSKRESVNA